MTPKKPEDSVYGKTILALDPADLLVLGRRFFDAKGRLQKVWTVDKVEKVDGIWTLRGQELADLQEKTRSRLDVEQIEYNVKLPDDMFTTKYLLR
jgi:outer membrane lipoprotein-sorting protein